MPRRSTSEKVPAEMRPRFDEITRLTDDFNARFLNDEVAALCRQMTATLCRKRQPMLVSGTATAWAAGITHAVGMVNFLFDRSQTPSVATSAIYAFFSVSQNTMQSRSKRIRDLLALSPLDTEWTLPSRIATNLLAWLVEVNGLIVDARRLPRHLQEEAFRRGLIPYVPEPPPPDV